MIKKYLLILIIVLAAILRLIHLSSIPASLNPDEAALGYNAYSLLKTGADEHGRFFPLTLQSFGDWKLAGYSYLSTVPIALFGLNEFSVRLVSAIAGVLGVYAIYLLAEMIFKRREISLIAAFFFAVSPWNIYFSRAAYEVNVGLTMFLFGLISFLKFTKAKKLGYFYLSSVLFGLTLFIYHGYIIFTPLFVFLLYALYRKEFFKPVSRILPVLVFVTFILGSYITTLHGGVNKIQTLNIFNDKNVLYGRVDKLRGDASGENALLKKIHTRYLGVPYQITQNYIGSFSPSFLFDKGGEKLVHNLGYFGNLYLFDALLLLVGFAGMFWQREKNLALLAIFVLVGPIPSIITNDTPNSTRLYGLLPFFVLVSAYGAYTLWKYTIPNKILSKVGKGILICLFLLNVLFFLDGYFVHSTVERARFWSYGFKQAVELSKQHPNAKVVMTNPKDFAYIYFLFYNQYDPREFKKTVVYYPPTDEGFYFVKHFGKYTFLDTINYDKLQKGTLYIDSTRLDEKSHLITLPNGDPKFGYMLYE